MKTLIAWFAYCTFFVLFDLNHLQHLVPAIVIEVTWIGIFAAIIAQGCLWKEYPIYKAFNK